MMISRQWRGLARADRADAYVRHLQSETFPGLRQLPGFVSASLLKRTVAEGVEFLVITQWKDVESIRAFAGANETAAVVPERVRAMMMAYDDVAIHYEMVI